MNEIAFALKCVYDRIVSLKLLWTFILVIIVLFLVSECRGENETPANTPMMSPASINNTGYTIRASSSSVKTLNDYFGRAEIASSTEVVRSYFPPQGGNLHFVDRKDIVEIFEKGGIGIYDETINDSTYYEHTNDNVKSSGYVGGMTPAEELMANLALIAIALAIFPVMCWIALLVLGILTHSFGKHLKKNNQ